LKIKFNIKVSKVMVLVIIIILTVGEISYAYNNSDITEPSKLEIIENYYKNHFDLTNYNNPVEYEIQPNLNKDFNAGKPKQKYLNEALNSVNFIRFLAGLPDDIKINTYYNLLAQNASAVNAKNNELTHHPRQTEGIPNENYELGYTGASSSNLGAGYSNIKDSVISGYMEDGDTSNIDRIGHRRWILNPPMKEIGFGYVDYYTATYVFDRKRNEPIKYDYISWPTKGYMPIEFITNYTPWSINLGKDYDVPQLEKLNIKLKNMVTKDEWTFNKHSNNNSRLSTTHEYFNVNNQGFGMDKCIIFRPNLADLNYNENDIFEVTIDGIYINGIESPIKYRVNLFSLMDSPSDWALKEVREAIDSSLVHEKFQSKYAENITRSDFCILVINLLEVKTGKSIEKLVAEKGKTIDNKSFIDTSDKKILSANALGIIKGKDKGRFDPNGHITRQEAAVMLSNVAKTLDINTNIEYTSQFLDENNIASWAKESVNFVSSAYEKDTGLKVMGGVGNNKFAPNDNYTRQQAFISIKRLY